MNVTGIAEPWEGLMAIPDDEKRAAIQSFVKEAHCRIVRDQGIRANPLPAASSGLPHEPSFATVLRVVKETDPGRRVKVLHNFRCQVCGIRLEGEAGPYAEAAHIRPLPEPHDGPDVLANLLCLCPNHHVLFERGGFTIGNDLSLIGLGGELRVVEGHTVAKKHLAYHRRLWAWH